MKFLTEIICVYTLLFTFIGAGTVANDADEVESIRSVGEVHQHYMPFIIIISEGFKEGQTIHVVGKIKEHPKRVDLNFHNTDVKSNRSMPLSLSARFDEGIFSGNIVFNNQKDDGSWNSEERISSPFKANEEYDIRVRIINGTFVIFGNRRYVGTFTQREPLNEVKYVSLTGDLEIVNVFHYGGAIFRNPYTAVADLAVGKRLDISAFPKGSRVNINLYTRDQEYALHISIRYDEGAIVRNSIVNHSWGPEERDGGFPLAKNELFDLTIVNERGNYAIYINAKKFTTFSHRISNSEISTVEIDGAVELMTVSVGGPTP